MFVAGDSPDSMTAIHRGEALGEKFLAGDCELRVINVIEDLADVEEEGILAAPALVREDLPPARRLIGDMSKANLILDSLAMALQVDRDL